MTKFEAIKQIIALEEWGYLSDLEAEKIIRQILGLSTQELKPSEPTDGL